MMHHASQGMRTALRKGSDAFVHHGGHNGPGSGTTANSRPLHISSNLRGISRILQPPFTPINTLESIRPRNPPHRLFSITKNVLQRLFVHLTTPGFRAPTYFAQSVQTGTRSLHNVAFRNSIQSGFSLAARTSLRNNALRRQSLMFFPAHPKVPPPRCGGIAEVGLGRARNFTTGPPFFQQVVENIPIAGRALYEVDCEFEMRKDHARSSVMAAKQSKLTQKTKKMLKPTQRRDTYAAISHGVDDAVSPSKRDLDHYFPSTTDVTTYLYVPLAPRMPLPQHRAPDDLTFLPFSDLHALHSAYTTHSLRVRTLLSRLEQAEVSNGVSSSCYSQGLRDRIESLNGVCTNMRLEFKGWTKTGVRSVIGESGAEWCALEEVWHAKDSDAVSEASLSLDSNLSHADGPTTFDPSESLIMPKLAFSASFLASSSRPSSDEDLYSLSSTSSSYSDLSDLSTY